MASLKKHLVHLIIVAYMKEERETKKFNTHGLLQNLMHQNLVEKRRDENNK